MLSGTVVAKLRRRFAPPGEAARGAGIHGLLGAAHEVSRRKAAAGEEAPRDTNVPGLAGVGGAEEGDLGRAQAESLYPSRLDERQGLEGLGRGSGKDRTGGVTARGQETTRLVHYGGVAAVAGLEKAAAQDPGKESGRLGHREFVSDARRG